MACMCGDSECWSCGSAQDTREQRTGTGPSSLLTIRVRGAHGWEERQWSAPIDASDAAAVRAEVSRYVSKYLAGRTSAGVQWDPKTCARPVGGLH